MPKKLIEAIFYGNYFYAICAVALSMEASLQQQYPLNNALFYVLLFSATVVYYIAAYRGEVFPGTTNKRSLWYARHKRFVSGSNLFFIAVMLFCIVVLVIDDSRNIVSIRLWQWLLIALFPAIAILYYGIPVEKFRKLSLRKTGWLKPFVIGFVWAGVVTVYPFIFHQVERNFFYYISLTAVWFFIKNFMFITLLCIMFDIKDYASDYNQHLKTFVVQIGLRKTIFYIIIPLSVLGFFAYIVFVAANHFPLFRIIINSIPFFLLIWVAYSLHRRKSILYYLVIIDGLMLVKSICGILGAVLIK